MPAGSPCVSLARREFTKRRLEPPCQAGFGRVTSRSGFTTRRETWGLFGRTALHRKSWAHGCTAHYVVKHDH